MDKGSSVESSTNLHAKIYFMVLPLSILLQVSRLGHLMSMLIKYFCHEQINNHYRTVTGLTSSGIDTYQVV